MFLWDLPVRWGWGPYSAADGAMTQLSCLGGTGRATPNCSLIGFLVGRGWEPSFIVGEVDQLFCLGLGRPGSRASRTLFEDLSLADPHPAEFPGHTVSLMWFCRRADPLVGSTTRALLAGT